MDKLKSMAVFVKVAELGSFAQAAHVLNISPQMVAKQISYLEYHLNNTLVQRTTRKQNLTEIGHGYYIRCKNILAEVDEAERFAFELDHYPKGIIRISAPVTFGASSCANFISKFLEKYPDIQIELNLSDRYVDVIDEGFDIAIRIGEPNILMMNSNLMLIPISPYRLITCASPTYLARHGCPQSPEDLIHHQCLIYALNPSNTINKWEFYQNNSTQIIEVQGRFRSNDWKALQSAAIQSFGITLGSEQALQTEIMNGTLVPILEDYFPRPKPMSALYKNTKKISTKMRIFIQELQQAYPS